MFRAILKIANRYQDKATTVRLRNQWVKVDPSAWDAIGYPGPTKP